MKFVPVLSLTACCLLAFAPWGASQTLQERTLTDAPVAPTPSHTPTTATAQTPTAAHPATSGQPSAQVTPAPTSSQPTSSPMSPVAQPAPAVRPAPTQPAAAPAAPPPPPAPAQPASSGATPINGSTNLSPPPPPPPPASSSTYDKAQIDRETQSFFESGSRGLAQIVSNTFRDLGQPNGFIKGSEAGGALILGLRYGSGTLYLKGRPPVPVYWQSPSLGIDIGVNAVKVFTLVYGMGRPDQIFQRFPGVDGSAYILGGFGVNYQRSGNTTLAPIRFGVGLRLGINVGYQAYTRTSTANPF